MIALLLASSAFAASALDPQIRLHLGLGVLADDLAPLGLTGGIDARLTRLLNIDLGGFGTLMETPAEAQIERDPPSSYFRLRHGVYVAPGIRIPHSQPKTWAWDLFVRGGAGVVFSQNIQPGVEDLDGEGYLLEPAPAGFAGGDLTVRGEKVGVRIGGKAWMYAGQQKYPADEIFVVAGQFAVEGVYQF